MNVDHHTFLKEYTDALRDGSASMFVGAGVSQAAGYVNWKQLLREIANDLGLDVDRESDLVALAQFHLTHRGSRDRLNQLLIDEFLEHAELTESHHLIASLPLHSVWTTNYDDLIEKACEGNGKRIDVKRRPSDFSTTRRRADVTIYKMHGDKTDPAEAVLTKEDYETYNPKRELFTIALKGDLTMRTFLFLGVSFADPNLLYLLARVKQLVDKNGRQHYCILKTPQPDDYEGADYDCKRFPHWLADLKRYNIQPVLVGSYAEVPAILRELNRRSQLRNVFISGSAADFSPLGEGKFRELCRTLGRLLIKSNFNVISGYGLGVGDELILGALQSLQRNDDERLQLWPFPQSVPPEERAAVWTQYRERMLSDAGVCVVMSGNKLEAGSVVPANGVRQEVEIARRRGKIVLPIGATGHVAKELWTEITAVPCAALGAADVLKQLAVLGDESASVDAIAKAVVDILKVLNR